MTDAQGKGTIVVTPSFLRRSAAAMRRCAAELAALGPPPRPLQPTYRMATQACAAFARAARLNVEVAQFLPNGVAVGPDPTLTKLINQATDALNQGIVLMARAPYESQIAPGS
jgi:hypothetical protein